MKRAIWLATATLLAGFALAEEPAETVNAGNDDKVAAESRTEESAATSTEDRSTEAGGEDASDPARAGDLVATASVPKDDDAAGDGAAQSGPKRISGMSVLGNQEAPKSLVIVPWKSSEIGDSLGISTMLDDGRQPVDRDVFLRALTYYEVRSGGAR